MIAREPGTSRMRAALPGLDVRGWTGRLRADSLLRNSLYLMATTVTTSLLGYLYWIAAARAYPASAVGLAAALIAPMTLAAALATLGIGPALVQTLPGRPAGRSWSQALNVGLLMGATAGLLAGVLLVLGLPLVSARCASALRDPLVAALLALGVPLWTVATVLDYAFIAERRAGNMLVRNGAFALLKLPLLALPLLAGHAGTAGGILASWVLAAFVSVLAGLLLVCRLGRGYRPTVGAMWGQARALLALLPGHHVITLGGTAPLYLLPLLVATRLSPQANAYFYVSWTMGGLFFTVSASVAASLFAEGTRANGELARTARRAALVTGAILAPAMLAVLLGGRYALGLFGGAYARYGLPLLLLLVVSAIPDAITNLYVAALRAQRRFRTAALLNLAMAALTLALAWALLPLLGIAGAGVAWLTAQIAGSVAVALRVLYARVRMPPPTPRNLAGLTRYLLLRLRYPALHGDLFYLGRGADVRIGRQATVRCERGGRFMRDASIHAWGRLIVGGGVFFNRGCTIVAHESISIGDHCLFGEYVSIHDDNHVPGRGPEAIAERGLVTAPIVIGNNVWVGAKATILPGVRIGDNAVIGANAVVTRDVPPYSVAVGAPARVVKEVASSQKPVASDWRASRQERI